MEKGSESQLLMHNPFVKNYQTDSPIVPGPTDSSIEGSEDPGSGPRDLSESADSERWADKEMDSFEPNASVLSQFHEDAISQVGIGAFQHILLLISGLALAADTIEILVIAYVIPSAEVEFCMSGVHKGWLGAITFVGMMIGAIIWGVMSDKIGRRRALLSALFVNAIFSLITCFMPTYSIFMLTRLCSGIGVGGGIPIVFAYFCEFIPRTDRGRHLSYLLIFWAIGGVFTALMAWAIIPRTGFTVVLDELHHFSSWRVFLVVCAIPSFVATIGLYFLPESPRFLLERGREVEAMIVYKKIFAWNHSKNPKLQYQISELELPAHVFRPKSNEESSNLVTEKGILADIIRGAVQILRSFSMVSRVYKSLTK